MANRLTEEELTLWKNRLLNSHKQHEKIEKVIKRGLDYYRGKHESFDQFENFIVENTVFSNINTILPSIAINNPKILVYARKKPYVSRRGGEPFLVNTVENAKVKQLQLNYWYTHLKAHRQVKKAVLDALTGVWGIIQLGYTVKTEKVGKKGRLLQVEEYIREQSPFIIRRSPLDFRKDPYSKDHHLSDAEWVALRWVKRLEDVQENPRFKNTKDLMTNFRFKADDAEADAMKRPLYKGGDMDDDRVEGWDILDKRNEKIITIVEGYDKELQVRDWPQTFDGGFPIEVIFFNENPDGDFPLSETDQYIDLQDVLNEMNSAQLAHVRKVSQRKYITKKGAFSEEEKFKLERGGDGTVVESDMDVDKAIKDMRDANVSQDLYITIASVRRGIKGIARVPAFEQGVAEKFDTATEPALMAQGLSVHRADRRQTVEAFVERTVSKLDKIIQQTIKTEEIPLTESDFAFAKTLAPTKLASVVGAQGQQILLPWLNLTKDEIQGEYEYEIEMGSMQPRNEETRKRDLIAISQLLQGNPFINTFRATQLMLDAFDIKDFQLLRDPKEVAQEQAQRQKQALEASLAERKLKDQTDLQKTVMKTTSAENIAGVKSSTDLSKALLMADKDEKEEPKEKEEK